MQRHECIELLEQLKLGAMRDAWDEVVTDGIARKRSTSDIIGRLLQTELTDRQRRSVQYRIAQAKFPQHKSLTALNLSNLLCISPVWICCLMVTISNKSAISSLWAALVQAKRIWRVL